MAVVEDNTIIFPELSPEEPGKGLLATFWNYLGRLAVIISDSKDDDDYRIYSIINLMINTIPLRESREEILQLREQKYKKYLGNGKSPSIKEQRAALVRASYDVVGNVMEYLDEFIGLHKKVRVTVEPMPEREQHGR